MGSVAIGVLTFIGICLAPVAFVSALLHGHQIAALVVSLGRRLGLVAPPPTPPSGPPLEKLAADLRRLRPQVRCPRQGLGAARIRGTRAAYDGVLILTARALEVETILGDLPDGFDREAERLRLEDALEQAGLSWQVQEH
ncbi:MAG: Conserved putative rane protein [Marmoricola sp.]|nr:Conserved putative rane protein [Marmoricola sp.]